MASVTVYDICEKSGVSIATVSRVLNGSSKVSSPTRRKVLSAAESLGYTPSFAARSLAKQRSDLLGAIFPRMASGFFADVLCGLDAAAKEAGLHLLTAFSHDDEDECALAERFVGQRLIGALVLMNFRFSDKFLSQLSANGVPVVSLDGATPAASSVSIDNAHGMHQLLAHISACGHKRAALLIGPMRTFDSEERLATCREMGSKLNVQLPEDWILQGSFTEEGGYRAAKELFSRPEMPTVILAFNDMMALGAMRAAREAGLRVPEDVSITGFDDIELASPFNLTTVHVPMFELGKAAGEVAAAALNDSKQVVHRSITPRLILRGTCARPRNVI